MIIFVFGMAYYAFGHLLLRPPDAFVYGLTYIVCGSAMIQKYFYRWIY